MTTVTLSASLSSLTTEVCKGDRTIRNKWAFLAEGYHSERITSLMLAKPEKGEKSPFEKLHKGIEKAIVASFDPDVQELIKKEPKTLDKIQQGVRRYWLQQIGSYFNKIRTHIAKLEEEEANPEESKSRKTRSKKDRIQDHLNQIVKIAKAYDSATFDVKAFLSKAKELDNLLNSK